MQLSVIIVSYNTAKLTLATVNSIYQTIDQKSPLWQNFEVIVVDNHSHDQTIDQLKKLKKNNLKIIAAQENLGFSRANNLGFKQATGQYILFLNSDTIVAPQSLEKLVAYYQTHQRDKKPLGLLAAQLVNTDGSYQPQGGDTPTLLSIFNTMFFIDDLPLVGRYLPAVQHTGRRFDARAIDKQTFISKDWVAGTAVLIYRELLEDNGGWDEQIFMYGEDQELSYRLHQLGYRHGILTTATITHLGSASSSSERALVGEIMGYFYFFRCYRRPNKLVYLKAILWLATVWRVFVFSYLKKDQKRARAYTNALAAIEHEKVD